jgi:hypothetical protein
MKGLLVGDKIYCVFYANKNLGEYTIEHCSVLERPTGYDTVYVKNLDTNHNTFVLLDDCYASKEKAVQAVAMRIRMKIVELQNKLEDLENESI